MSDARHTVTAGDSLIGAGEGPSFTPCHQVDLLTGMIGGIAGFAGLPHLVGLAGRPMMFASR